MKLRELTDDEVIEKLSTFEYVKQWGTWKWWIVISFSRSEWVYWNKRKIKLSNWDGKEYLTDIQYIS